jgi:DNA-binding MarR family transcriptional regulator
MSLEHDIQQKAFRSEYQKAILNIVYTQNFLVGRMQDVFKRFGITRQQYNVLRILRGQFPEPASINLIKERMLEKMSDSSRIVERLRIKGLITRSDAKSDKRSTEVTITQAGLELLKQMKTPVDALDNMLQHLTLDEARELNLLLEKVRFTNDQPDTEKLLNSLELMTQAEKF